MREQPRGGITPESKHEKLRPNPFKCLELADMFRKMLEIKCVIEVAEIELISKGGFRKFIKGFSLNENKEVANGNNDLFEGKSPDVFYGKAEKVLLFSRSKETPEELAHDFVEVDTSKIISFKT